MDGVVLEEEGGPAACATLLMALVAQRLRTHALYTMVYPYKLALVLHPSSSEQALSEVSSDNQA